MAVPLAETLLDRLRAMPKDEARDALDHCLTILVMLDTWRGDVAAREVVDAALSRIPESAAELHHVLGHLRDTLTEGLGNRSGPATASTDAARRRAFAIYCDAIRRASSFLRGLKPGLTSADSLYEQARDSALILDSIAHQVYFAAGGASDGAGLTGEGRRRLYEDCGPLFELLADAGVASATYRVLGALELFIPVDPPGVFVRVSRLTVASQSSGYQFESLAADLAVKLVQRFIADYLGVLRSSSETRRALLDILEVFAKIGWLSARQLTSRLQEIYR